MRKIRASEINTFLFCERSWWYQQQGIESSNLEDLAGGVFIHKQHSQAIVASSLLRIFAYGMLLAGLVIFAVNLVLQIL
jgi:hypothetical protein